MQVTHVCSAAMPSKNWGHPGLWAKTKERSLSSNGRSSLLLPSLSSLEANLALDSTQKYVLGPFLKYRSDEAASLSDKTATTTATRSHGYLSTVERISHLLLV